jgi:hypothetical protein
MIGPAAADRKIAIEVALTVLGIFSKLGSTLGDVKAGLAPYRPHP